MKKKEDPFKRIVLFHQEWIIDTEAAVRALETSHADTGAKAVKDRATSCKNLLDEIESKREIINSINDRYCRLLGVGKSFDLSSFLLKLVMI